MESRAIEKGLQRRHRVAIYEQYIFVECMNEWLQVENGLEEGVLKD